MTPEKLGRLIRHLAAQGESSSSRIAEVLDGELTCAAHEGRPIDPDLLRAELCALIDAARYAIKELTP